MDIAAIKVFLGGLARRIKSGTPRSIPSVILLPKPLDWIQQKLWRIYWLEWALAILLLGIEKDLLVGFDIIIVPIVGGLVMTFCGNAMMGFCLSLTKLIGNVSKMPHFRIIWLTFMEVFMLTISINYAMISRFSVEKLRVSPMKMYLKKRKFKFS